MALPCAGTTTPVRRLFSACVLAWVSLTCVGIVAAKIRRGNGNVDASAAGSTVNVFIVWGGVPPWMADALRHNARTLDGRTVVVAAGTGACQTCKRHFRPDPTNSNIQYVCAMHHKDLDDTYVHNSFVSRRTQMYMIYRFFHLADICKNTAKVFAGVTRLRFYDTDIVFLSGDPFGVAGVDAARAAQYDVVATHHHGSYFVDFSCKGLLDYVTFIRSLYSGPRKVLQNAIESFAHKYVPLRGAEAKYGAHSLDNGTGFPNKFKYYEFSDMHIFAAYLHHLSPSPKSCLRGRACASAGSVGPGQTVLLLDQTGPLRYAMKIPNSMNCSVPIGGGAPIVGAHFQGRCKGEIASFLHNISVQKQQARQSD